MRSRARGAILVSIGSLVLAAAVPPVVATDSAPTGGRAASSGTLIELVVGDETLSFASDRSTTRRGREASASMILGATGDAEIGRIATSSTKAGSKRDALGPGTLSLLGAGIVNVADSEVLAQLDDDDRAFSRIVTSVIGADLAAVAEVGAITQQVTSVAAAGRSRSIRSVEVADLTVLTVEQLLDALGLGLLSLPCTSVAALAGELGADATDACTQLDALTTQLDAALAILTDAEAVATTLRDTTQPLRDAQQTVVDTLTTTVTTLTAERDALLAQAAGLDRGDLEASLADLQAEIAALQPPCTNLGLLCDVLASVTAEADEVTAQLALLDELDAADAALTAAQTQLDTAADALQVLDATLAQALSILDALALGDVGELPTCEDAAAALAEAAGLVPALAGAAATVSGALDAACTTLGDELDALLATPILALHGVEVLLDATSTDGGAQSIVDGTIGSITIGALPPTAQDIEIDDLPAIQDASDAVGDMLDDVLGSLGFVVPDLQVRFLRTRRVTEIADDGSSSAEAALGVLDVRAPATPTALPGVAPFGPLAGLLPAAQGPSGNVTLPAFRLTAGSFEASSAFPVAATRSGPTGGGGSTTGGGLPLTGVEHRWDIAALLLLAAHLLRRRLLAVR